MDGRVGAGLTERLTAHPRYVLGALERDEPWIDPRLHPHVRALADPVTGLAREDARPVGLAWQEPDGGIADDGVRRRVASTCTVASTRRAAAPTAAATSTRSTATGRRSPHAVAGRACRASTADVRAALGRAQDDPAGSATTTTWR